MGPGRAAGPNRTRVEQNGQDAAGAYSGAFEERAQQ